MEEWLYPEKRSDAGDAGDADWADLADGFGGVLRGPSDPLPELPNNSRTAHTPSAAMKKAVAVVPARSIR